MLELEADLTETHAVAQENAAEALAAPQKRTNLPFAVELEFFAGPMDLLLHLVSQQEVPIEQVKMSVVAEQYLAIVTKEALRLDLEKASEYLVIAATLLAIKSKSLLPFEQEQEEEGSDIESFDSRFFADLRARIKAYQITKSRAVALRRTPQLGVDTFYRTDRKALKPTAEMLAQPESVYNLGTLFAKLLKRIGDSAGMLRISVEPVSVVSYMMRIVDAFSSKGEDKEEVLGRGEALSFSKLIRRFVPSKLKDKIRSEETRDAGLRQSRGVVIGTFVAALELVKRGLMSASLAEEESDVFLSLRMDGEPLEFNAKNIVSEFDEPREESPSEERQDLAVALESDPEEERRAKVVDIATYRKNDSEREAVEEKSEAAAEDVSFEEEFKEVGNV